MAVSKRTLFIAVGVSLAVIVVVAIILGVVLTKDTVKQDPPNALPAQERTGAKLLGVQNTGDAIPNQWVVTFRRNTPINAIVEEIETAGMPWGVNSTHNTVGSMSMYCPDSVIETAVGMPQMSKYAKYVERDRLIATTQTVWGLDRINQRDLPLDGIELDASSPNGAGVNVYVLDTGIRTTHLDFGGRAQPTMTFVNDGKGSDDCNGHGTHVAGTVGGRVYGVAKGATLHAVRVLDCQGLGTISSVIGGIDWVTANHVKPAVASLSLGGGASSSLDAAVRNSIQAGVTYVVAAGNDNIDACNASPARVTEAITVGASTIADDRATFSNYGSCVDIFAPGKDIMSAWWTTDTATQTISGTSMATPHVSGVAALYLQNNPDATPAEVSYALTGGASKDKLTVATLAQSPNDLLYWPVDGSNSGGNNNGSTTGNDNDPSDDSICGRKKCKNETVYLGASNAYNFHPGDTYFQSKEGGDLEAWLEGPNTDADFDLALFKFVDSQWQKVAASEGGTSQESVTYTGTPGYYVWRVRSFDGIGNYNIAMVNAA